ncbi:hypothetical protein [Rheinheimera maricola]|uniref:Uncharacterized protein n=1 Tax=Rheinheimera maricola TaxID=2793282 RepID=A0ABS7XA65_9GAMM|nr:hypothetical protein [Rheinheimera maricola]MBZ9612438.1 hypothetical protein [Rheinheimera maricola]
MRWLSSFALLLYICLLCTPQAFAVHDQRLSPLADTQFHAVTPASPCYSFYSESDNSDEPPPVLPLAVSISPAPVHHSRLFNRLITSKAGFLSAVKARAPPATSSS